MSGITKNLLAAARREVTLPESGLEIRILRANVYHFLKLRVPMGSLLQALSGAAWSVVKGEEISDETACKINAGTPTYADLCERLIEMCVYEMRAPGEEWIRVQVVGNDEESNADEDKIRVEDFCRGLMPNDLSVLQGELWDHNGLSKGVELMLGPFRQARRGAAPPDGGELREAADGNPEAGPAPVQPERGGDDGGGECGSGGDEAGAGGGGKEVEG